MVLEFLAVGYSLTLKVTLFWSLSTDPDFYSAVGNFRRTCLFALASSSRRMFSQESAESSKRLQPQLRRLSTALNQTIKAHM